MATTANQFMQLNRNQLATIRPHDLRRIQARDEVTASLANSFDGMSASPIKQRRIILAKAGEFYRARYEGRQTNVFVYEPEHAVKKLRFFDGGGNHAD
jgi:hypothetical protein